MSTRTITHTTDATTGTTTYTTTHDLSEDKRFFIVEGVETVVGDGPRTELLAYRVSRQSVHVHLNVGTNLLVRQELTRDNLSDGSVKLIKIHDQSNAD